MKKYRYTKFEVLKEFRSMGAGWMDLIANWLWLTFNRKYKKYWLADPWMESPYKEEG